MSKKHVSAAERAEHLWDHPHQSDIMQLGSAEERASVDSRRAEHQLCLSSTAVHHAAMIIAGSREDFPGNAVLDIQPLFSRRKSKACPDASSSLPRICLPLMKNAGSGKKRRVHLGVATNDRYLGLRKGSGKLGGPRGTFRPKGSLWLHSAAGHSDAKKELHLGNKVASLLFRELANWPMEELICQFLPSWLSKTHRLRP
jgi:hypothetical protein